VVYVLENHTLLNSEPLNISDENALRIFERKVIKKIYCPVCEDGVWRFREINCLLQGEEGARGSVVGRGTMLQAGRSRNRVPMRRIFSIYLILPAAL
jgi:hypothetical protein